MTKNTSSSALSISVAKFGLLTNGESADLYTLKNQNGITLTITNYGGIIVSLHTYDNKKQLADIVLGYPDVTSYERDPYYLGAIIGRYAGRIDQGKLSIDDIDYQLTINNTDNQLHGGHQALNKQLWRATTSTDNESVCLELSHSSPDGDNGFPGNLDFTVKYRLNKNNELTVEYFAQTDKSTVVNLTQHSYFNLAGHQAGPIEQHLVSLNADYFLPMDERIYPSGEIRAVANTAHDFRALTPLAKHIHSDDEQIVIAKGYDNYWLNNDSAISQERYSAQVVEPQSGRRLTLYTDQPCLILYTANYVDGSQCGKDGHYYQQHQALCLEPQRLANRNTGADINNTLLTPNQAFYSKTTFVFDTVSAAV